MVGVVNGRGQGVRFCCLSFSVDYVFIVFDILPKTMGALCCCGKSDELSSRKISQHSTMEPLLRESEREAVSAILKFLDSGV